MSTVRSYFFWSTHGVSPHGKICYHEGSQQTELGELWTGQKKKLKFLLTFLQAFNNGKKVNDQTLKIDTFYRQPVSSAQSITTSEEYVCAGIKSIYLNGKWSQCYGRIEQALRSLIKDDIFQPYTFDQYFCLATRKIRLLIIYKFSIHDNRKLPQRLDYKKKNLGFLGAGLQGYMVMHSH